MAKDTEIRRLALLKSGGASLSPATLLYTALEILKNDSGGPTVDKLFNTAVKIAERLPELKKIVNAINLDSAKEMENWVIDESLETGAKEVTGKGNAAQEYAEKFEELLNESQKPVEKADPPAEEDFVLEVESPKKDVVVGTIGAVSRTGKGIKIGDVWYNITERTSKKVIPERGMKVKVLYVQGNYGLLVDTLEAAA